MPGEVVAPGPCTPKGKQQPGVSATPSGSFLIPATPTMKRLGYGTGVNVMLYERSSPRQGAAARSPWAVKRLRRKDGSGGYVGRRLEREAEILRRLDHPNIIGFRGFFRAARTLAMEHGSASLMDRLEEMRRKGEQPPLDPRRMQLAIRGVASALDYLHVRQRLLHGDVKSANVLVASEDFAAVKLCDFGVAVDLDDAAGPKYVGTEPWSAPEVVLGDGVSEKTDVFAFGCTVYEMLTFEVPHYDRMPDVEGDDDDSEDSDSDEYNDAIGTRPRLPERLAQHKDSDALKPLIFLFEAMTEERQEDRPSAKAVLDVLDEA